MGFNYRNQIEYICLISIILICAIMTSGCSDTESPTANVIKYNQEQAKDLEIPINAGSNCIDDGLDKLAELFPDTIPKGYSEISVGIYENSKGSYMIESDKDGRRITIEIEDLCGKLNADRYIENDYPLTLNHDEYDWTSYNNKDALLIHGNTLMFSADRYIITALPYQDKNTDKILSMLNLP